MTFIPEGYETLDAVRERMGVEGLGAALAGDRLKAFYLDPWGALKGIDASSWRTGNAEVAIQSGRTIGHYNSQTGKRGTGHLILVKQLLGGKPRATVLPLAQSSEAKTAKPKGNGGRPSKYDWEAALIEAAAYVHEKGLPKTQAEFLAYIQEWFSKRNPPQFPSESQVKLRIGPLFRRIKAGVET
jgi:hypothetical protein